MLSSFLHKKISSKIFQSIVFFTFLFLAYGFFVPSAYAGMINVKVLAVSAGGPTVGGTSDGFPDGKIVTVRLYASNNTVTPVATKLIPISSNTIAPTVIPFSLTTHQGEIYTIDASVLDPVNTVLANSNDTFQAGYITGVSIGATSPTSAQVNITSFGGDNGLTARLRYKEIIAGTGPGAVLWNFLGAYATSYVEFPLYDGTGFQTNPFSQILLGLNPHTTYAYKIDIVPTDNDHDGLNDSFLGFTSPTAFYTLEDGPALWGTATNLPTFTTPSFPTGGGQNGGNGNGNGASTFVPPDINISSLIVDDSSFYIEATVSNIPSTYTTELYVHKNGYLVTNEPVATGPATFSTIIVGLDPSTTYQYHFSSYGTDGSISSTIVFPGSSLQTTSITSTESTTIIGSGGLGVQTTTGVTHPAGYDVVSDPNQSLVPCTGVGTDVCDFNKLIELIKRVTNFLLFTLSISIAGIMFAYAGILFLTSGGNASAKEKATSIFKKVLFGLIIALAAWLIVTTILGAFGLKAGFSWLGLIS
jgi:Type IV secretion system pilin